VISSNVSPRTFHLLMITMIRIPLVMLPSLLITPFGELDVALEPKLELGKEADMFNYDK